MPLQGLAADDIYSVKKTELANYHPLLAGQGLRLLKRDESVSEIVNEIVSTAITTRLSFTPANTFPSSLP
jgi:hypothetical protein